MLIIALKFRFLSKCIWKSCILGQSMLRGIIPSYLYDVSQAELLCTVKNHLYSCPTLCNSVRCWIRHYLGTDLHHKVTQLTVQLNGHQVALPETLKEIICKLPV